MQYYYIYYTMYAFILNIIYAENTYLDLLIIQVI